jgi:phosphoadenosine phosphosulfate reductase
MSIETAQTLNAAWAGASPAEAISLALDYFGAERIAFSTSLGAEDQVITDILWRNNLPAPVFTLDTGRLPEETYRLLEETRKRYGLAIEVLFPEAETVQKMQSEHGPNLFYESIENRRLCCRARKVEPLSRKLSTLSAWICGLRRSQSVTRHELQLVEWDETFGLFKLNPLVLASEEWIWEYIRDNDVPYNELHDKGYPSIGCGPCTRAIEPGEDIRAGRWWWEQPELKECGLHSAHAHQR